MGSAISKDDEQVQEKINSFLSKCPMQSKSPFWDEFLMIPLNLYVDEFSDTGRNQIASQFKMMLNNNSQSGHFRTLLDKFVVFTTLPSPSDIEVMKATNAIFLIRTFLRLMVENLSESEIQWHLMPIESEQNCSDQQTIKSVKNGLELLVQGLIRVLTKRPTNEEEYNLQIECATALVILLSIQMFSESSASSFFIYNCIMRTNPDIADLLIKTLLENFINHTMKGEVSLFGLTGIWSIFNQNSSDDKKTDSLGDLSVWLILILVHHCTHDDKVDTVFRRSIFSFNNIDGDTASEKGEDVLMSVNVVGTPQNGDQPSTQISNDAVNNINRDVQNGVTNEGQSTSNGKFVEEGAQTLTSDPRVSFNVDFSRLYAAICKSIEQESTALLLYTLLHRNPNVRNYILARTDIELVVVSLLKRLYTNKDSNSYHIYLCLINLLLLSEDSLFSRSCHLNMLKGITWLTQRNISEISLGGLIVIVVLRTIHVNMTCIRDDYLNANCLATLANMSEHFVYLHPYVCQKLVNLVELLAKKYTRLRAELSESYKNSSSSEAMNVEFSRSPSPPSSSATIDVLPDHIGEGTSETNGTKKAQSMVVLCEVLHMLLEVLNMCLVKHLPHNPNLIYAILHRKEIFAFFRGDPHFQDILRNIEHIIECFSAKLDEITHQMTGSEVMTVVQNGCMKWPANQLVIPTELRFRYIEDKNSEIFFIPCIWTIIRKNSVIPFSRDKVQVYFAEEERMAV